MGDTEGGGQTDNKRSGDTGGGGEKTLVHENEGKRGPRRVQYIFLNSADSSSLSGKVITLTEGITFWMSRLNLNV